MTGRAGRGNKAEFPMNGPLREFAFEVAQEIARDIKEPVFPAMVAQDGQNLVKTDHGNSPGTLGFFP